MQAIYYKASCAGNLTEYPKEIDQQIPGSVFHMRDIEDKGDQKERLHVLGSFETFMSLYYPHLMKEVITDKMKDVQYIIIDGNAAHGITSFSKKDEQCEFKLKKFKMHLDITNDKDWTGVFDFDNDNENMSTSNKKTKLLIT